MRLVAEQRLWPDPARKPQQARKSLAIARAMVESGDHDAAVEQVRTALSLIARWRLLEDGQFPLARAELPAQLEELDHTRLAIDLDATIHDAPPLHQLGLFVNAAYDLLDPPPTRVELDTIPSCLIRPADPASKRRCITMHSGRGRGGRDDSRNRPPLGSASENCIPNGLARSHVVPTKCCRLG
jgi:hypothetical protein